MQIPMEGKLERLPEYQQRNTEEHYRRANRSIRPLQDLVILNVHAANKRATKQRKHK